MGLLRDVPRTATVTATEDTTLHSLARERTSSTRCWGSTSPWPRRTTSSCADWAAPETPCEAALVESPGHEMLPAPGVYDEATT